MLTEQKGIQVDKFYPPTDWQYSFPEGYTRLEYLESTGTQWIDTNVQSSSDLIVDTEYYYESGYFFGYSETIDGVNKSYGYPSNVSSSYLRIGGGYVYNNSEWGTNKWLNLHIENSRNNVTLNGVTFSNTGGSFGTHTFSNGGNITLGRYANTNFVGKVKYFRIKQGNTLLRNLIPVKRNSDNKPGMYDLVNDVFYTNAGIGEFVMGTELYSNYSQIDIRQKNNTNFVEKYKFNENNELIWANPQLNLSGPVGYTKVGSPTITDNVVSGFSATSYIATLQVLKINNDFEFFTKINITDISSTNPIFRSNGGRTTIRFNTEKKLQVIAYDANNTYFSVSGSTVLALNIDYYIRFKVNNGIAIVSYSLDGITFINEITHSFSQINETTVILGSNSPNYLKGTIDLKETYIKVNNKLWFYGKNYTSENYAPVPAGLNCKIKGPISYTEVGTLTNNDGVYSGFSANDYLSLSQPFKLNANTVAEFVFKINIVTISTGSGFFGTLGSYGIQIKMTSSGKLQVDIGDGSSWSIAKGILETSALSTNTDYFVKLIFNKQSVSLLVSTDGVNYNGNTTTIVLNQEYTYNLYYGIIRLTSTYFEGSIDMNETYITVNSQPWFGFQQVTPSIGYVNTQTQEFIPAPTDGIKYSQTRDIKVIPPEDNTITLLYGVASDFSKYSLFGLFVQVSSGTYNVYIDDVLYVTTASNTQTDIDFSALGSEYVPIGTCTTPEELVLHKIVIKPATSRATITRFGCRRHSSSSVAREPLGCMWGHFELQNSILLLNSFQGETTYRNFNLYAITAKNNKIILTTNSSNNSGIYGIVGDCSNLIYLPILEISDSNYSGGTYRTFTDVPAKRIIIKNNGSLQAGFLRLCKAEKIEIENPIKLQSSTASVNNANSARNLKLYPKTIKDDTTTTLLAQEYTSLYPTKINDSLSINREYLNIAGTSNYPARGLRGLKVSNEAPFTGDSPQINVSYTGLDRDALVELFKSMPGYMQLTKVGEPTIDSNGVASGFSSSNYLQFPTIDNFLTEDFELKFVIKTPTNIPSSNATIFFMSRYRVNSSSADGSLILIGNDNKLRIYGSYKNEDDSAPFSSSFTYSTNTKYYLKLKQESGVISSWYSLDDITYTKIKEENGYGYSGNLTAPLRIGVNNNLTDEEVYINECYLIINNARYQFQLPDDTTSRAINITTATGNNLTKVGTPTIDENGVASGFDNSNYLQVSTFPKETDITKYEFVVKFTVQSLVETTRYILSYKAKQREGLFINSQNKIRFIFSRILNTTTDIGLTSSALISVGDTIICRALYEGNNVWALYVSKDNGLTWIKDTVTQDPSTLNNVNTNTSIIIGGSQQFSGYESPFTDGSIDLNQSYIKVGQNHIMKGYLTDNDRLIATNKGWTITG